MCLTMKPNWCLLLSHIAFPTHKAMSLVYSLGCCRTFRSVVGHWERSIGHQDTAQRVLKDQGGRGCSGAEPGEQISNRTITGTQDTSTVTVKWRRKGISDGGGMT